MRSKDVFSKIGPRQIKVDVNEIAANNPEEWKRMKQSFDIGRKISIVQYFNGLDRNTDNILREYSSEFVNRFLKVGHLGFPSSFNVLELFFYFNKKYTIFHLLEEEENYNISLEDFLEFVTGSDFELDEIDLFENIQENLIYHISFNDDYDEINFLNKDKRFVVSSLSLVRRDNEVALLMHAGETFDESVAEQILNSYDKDLLQKEMIPIKKKIGLEICNNDQPKIVSLDNKQDLWLHNVMVLFDIENKTMDIRSIARDENLSYRIFTDDYYALFFGQNLNEKEISTSYQDQLDKLSEYDAVFDFAKYCLAIPFYLNEKEENIIDVNYETKLNSLIKGPISRREYKDVPTKYKLFAKPVYYLEYDNNKVLNTKELDDKYFNVERGGYWKRIGFDETGFDKKGKCIIGKTWVENNNSYFVAKKGITVINSKVKFEGENAGYIYIMREPSHIENLFKVGLTRRDPETRRRELSNTSSPANFLIVNNYPTKDCLLAEKLIHDELEIFRINSKREYFKCDLEIITKTCEEIIKQINEE